jgi:hypothetical protein
MNARMMLMAGLVGVVVWGADPLPQAKVEIKGAGPYETARFTSGGLPHLKYTRRWADVPAECEGWVHVRALPVMYPKVRMVARSDGAVYMAVAEENVRACRRHGWRDTGMEAAVVVGTRWRRRYVILAKKARNGGKITFPRGMKGELSVFLVPILVKH